MTLPALSPKPNSKSLVPPAPHGAATPSPKLRALPGRRPTRNVTPPRNKERHLHAVEPARPERQGQQQGETHPLPPPESAIQRLALYAFEAVEGFRPISQLGRLITPSAIEALQMQRSARVQRRSLFRDTRRPVPSPGPAHLSSPAPGILESVVVLLARPRSTAVSLRFEFRVDRWQASQITIL